MSMVSDRGDAIEMVVTGPWSDEQAETVKRGKVERLVLNYALGFEETSLDFLQGLPIAQLVIMDPRQKDLSPVQSLGATLKLLNVTTDPSASVDMTWLPNLRQLHAAWRQVEQSISSATSLRVAHLRAYRPHDLTPIIALRNLTEITMKDQPRLHSLGGLSNLPALTKIGIYLAKNLNDICELQGRDGISELELQACRKVYHLDELSGCVGLERLNLSECGDVRSLKPISGLKMLKRLYLFGSTRVLDNDLTPIASLPLLEHLQMQSRRSYRPTVEELKESLPLL